MQYEFSPSHQTDGAHAKFHSYSWPPDVIYSQSSIDIRPVKLGSDDVDVHNFTSCLGFFKIFSRNCHYSKPFVEMWCKVELYDIMPCVPMRNCKIMNSRLAGKIHFTLCSFYKKQCKNFFYFAFCKWNVKWM